MIYFYFIIYLFIIFKANFSFRNVFEISTHPFQNMLRNIRVNDLCMYKNRKKITSHVY